MFDIGFAELILIGVVGLLVIGPERLPGAIRTASLWLNRIKRSFNDIKREVQQELHNDEVMQELRKTGAQIKSQADQIGQSVEGLEKTSSTEGVTENLAPLQPDATPPAEAAAKTAPTTGNGPE